MGAIAPLAFFGRVLLVVALAVLSWVLVGRIDRGKVSSDNTVGTF